MSVRDEDEDARLRSAALQSVQSIVQARQRAEQQLVKTKEALEEETRVLELLNKTGVILASNLDRRVLIQAITDAATELSGAQLGAFLYAETHEGDAYVRCAPSGVPCEAFQGFPARARSLFQVTIRGGPVVRIADLQQEDARWGGSGAPEGVRAAPIPVRSYLAVPVVARSGGVLGGLFFGHRDPDVFTERAERLIVGIASQAAIAIDNARLYEAAKKAAEDRTRLLEAERAARAEVERVSVLKDEFVATLSHELRTPLNAIFGWAKILLSRAEGMSPKARHGVETILRNAQAQLRLVEDLLDMSRIVSGKIRLDVQPIELRPLVLAAVDAVRPSADAKSIRIRATLDGKAEPVLGDPNRIQQIVWNLMTNAVKFTPKGGTIDVVLQRVDSHFEIVVQDTGVGIPPDFLPHIFERFRQADSSTTRRFGGLGIGLSIVKQLVELHGGSVRVESAGQGQGTAFVVSLPVRAVHDFGGSRLARSTEAGETPLGHLHVSLSGIDVLVVDDQEDARELVREVLIGADARVQTAATAEEALALVKSQRPDVIVSDIGMPDRDGYDFIRGVRALAADAGGRTPAIAVTAFAGSEDRTRAMLAGYQGQMAKPVDPQELVATIRSIAMAVRRER